MFLFCLSTKKEKSQWGEKSISGYQYSTFKLDSHKFSEAAVQSPPFLKGDSGGFQNVAENPPPAPL